MNDALVVLGGRDSTAQQLFRDMWVLPNLSGMIRDCRHQVMAAAEGRPVGHFVAGGAGATRATTGTSGTAGMAGMAGSMPALGTSSSHSRAHAAWRQICPGGGAQPAVGFASAAATALVSAPPYGGAASATGMPCTTTTASNTASNTASTRAPTAVDAAPMSNSNSGALLVVLFGERPSDSTVPGLGAQWRSDAAASGAGGDGDGVGVVGGSRRASEASRRFSATVSVSGRKTPSVRSHTGRQSHSPCDADDASVSSQGASVRHYVDSNSVWAIVLPSSAFEVALSADGRAALVPPR